nr:hypothetical protein [Pandoravirus massiliensis]
MKNNKGRMPSEGAASALCFFITAACRHPLFDWLFFVSPSHMDQKKWEPPHKANHHEATPFFRQSPNTLANRCLVSLVGQCTSYGHELTKKSWPQKTQTSRREQKADTSASPWAPFFC